LIDNCRNTQKIQTIVATFYHDALHLRCPGPPGRPPEIFEYQDSNQQIRNHIQVSSVHIFKGLESSVVILAEIDPSASRILDSVLYVGCSRARTHLILLLDRKLDEETKAKIRSV
jgi:superfamily I DNA/RNA helicase